MQLDLKPSAVLTRRDFPSLIYVLTVLASVTQVSAAIMCRGLGVEWMQAQIIYDESHCALFNSSSGQQMQCSAI